MKMKRLLAWLLVFVICFLMTACGSGESPFTDLNFGEDILSAKGPILYRVTDNMGNTAWLFGSIHIGREDFYPLPEHVLRAFDGADSLAVEMDIIAFEKDMAQQMQMTQTMMYRDGTTIRDHIPEELYTKAVEVLQEGGYYMSMLDRFAPVMWSSMIDSMLYEQLGINIQLGVDRHLLERAYSANKEILEVESAQLQYSIMAGFSDELQALLLEGSLETYEMPELAKAQIASMLDAWQSGDEAELGTVLDTEQQNLSADEMWLYEEYRTALIKNRNLSMTAYAENALRSGKEVFICVGAAHVVGDGAMAQLLAQRGYTVQRVTQ